MRKFLRSTSICAVRVVAGLFIVFHAHAGKPEAITPSLSQCIDSIKSNQTSNSAALLETFPLPADVSLIGLTGAAYVLAKYNFFVKAIAGDVTEAQVAEILDRPRFQKSEGSELLDDATARERTQALLSDIALLTRWVSKSHRAGKTGPVEQKIVDQVLALSEDILFLNKITFESNGTEGKISILAASPPVEIATYNPGAAFKKIASIENRDVLVSLIHNLREEEAGWKRVQTKEQILNRFALAKKRSLDAQSKEIEKAVVSLTKDKAPASKEELERRKRVMEQMESAELEVLAVSLNKVRSIKDFIVPANHHLLEIRISGDGNSERFLVGPIPMP